MRALAVWCSLAWARGTDTVQTDTLELLDLKELEAMRARSEDGQVPLPGSEHPSPTPKATEARKNSNDKQHEATAKAPQRREAKKLAMDASEEKARKAEAVLIRYAREHAIGTEGRMTTADVDRRYVQAAFERTCARQRAKGEPPIYLAQGLNNVLNGLLLAVVINRTFAIVDPGWSLSAKDTVTRFQQGTVTHTPWSVFDPSWLRWRDARSVRRALQEAQRGRNSSAAVVRRVHVRPIQRDAHGFVRSPRGETKVGSGSESIGWLACEDLEAERAPVLDVSMAEDWSAGLLLLANGRLGAGARARASSLLDLGRHPARLYAALYRLLFHRAADDSLVAAEVRLAGPLEAHADRMLSEYAGLLPDYAHISDVDTTTVLVVLREDDAVRGAKEVGALTARALPTPTPGLAPATAGNCTVVFLAASAWSEGREGAARRALDGRSCAIRVVDLSGLGRQAARDPAFLHRADLHLAGHFGDVEAAHNRVGHVKAGNRVYTAHTWLAFFAAKAASRADVLVGHCESALFGVLALVHLGSTSSKLVAGPHCWFSYNASRSLYRHTGAGEHPRESIRGWRAAQIDALCAATAEDRLASVEEASSVLGAPASMLPPWALTRQRHEDTAADLLGRAAAPRCTGIRATWIGALSFVRVLADAIKLEEDGHADGGSGPRCGLPCYKSYDPNRMATLPLRAVLAPDDALPCWAVEPGRRPLVVTKPGSRPCASMKIHFPFGKTNLGHFSQGLFWWWSMLRWRKQVGADIVSRLVDAPVVIRHFLHNAHDDTRDKYEFPWAHTMLSVVADFASRALNDTVNNGTGDACFVLNSPASSGYPKAETQWFAHPLDAASLADAARVGLGLSSLLTCSAVCRNMSVGKRRIFIYRREHKRMSRRISNAHELKEGLLRDLPRAVAAAANRTQSTVGRLEADVQVGDFEKRGLRPQVEEMADADVYVGTHGSESANTVFQRPCAAFVHLMPHGVRMMGHDGNLAAEAGRLYYPWCEHQDSHWLNSPLGEPGYPCDLAVGAPTTPQKFPTTFHASVDEVIRLVAHALVMQSQCLARLCGRDCPSRVH